MRGKVFLTEEDGVPYWMNKAEEHAEANSDDVKEDGLVPVVLRVAPGCTSPRINRHLKPDAIGTRDALADAWTTHKTIDPGCLDVFVGPPSDTWEEIDEWERIDPALAFDPQDVPDDEKDEYGEPEHYWHFRDPSPFNPFPY